MAAIATWGTWNFDDKEVTSFDWTMPTTTYIEIPRISGYPAVQQTGDTLGSISIGLRFGGANARTRLNDLKNFAILNIQAVNLGSTYLGFFYRTSLKVNYLFLASPALTAIAVNLELKEDA